MAHAFSWMAWTLEIAVFFTSVILMLIGMTVWQLKSPSIERKGFLPIPTTRGDRLFIGLLSAAYVNLAWAGLTLTSIDRHGVKIPPQRLRHHLAHGERGARGRVALVAVVGFHNLDIDGVAQHPCGGFEQHEGKVHAGAEIRGLADGHTQRGAFDG